MIPFSRAGLGTTFSMVLSSLFSIKDGQIAWGALGFFGQTLISFDLIHWILNPESWMEDIYFQEVTWYGLAASFEVEYISFLHNKHQNILDSLAAGKLDEKITSTLETVAEDLSSKYAL